MPTPTAVRGPIPVTFTPGGITVRPEDAARYLRLVDRAAESRRDAPERDPCDHEKRDHRESFERDFLRPLRAWCERHADKVAACYVPFPRGMLELGVVTRRARYDDALGTAMSENDMALFAAGWHAVSLTVGAAEFSGEFASYFNPDGALEVYADRQPAPREGREEPGVPGDDRDR